MRNLTNSERDTLTKLLSSNFVGADNLRKQLSNIKAEMIGDYKNNYGSISLHVNKKHAAKTNMRVPVTAMGKDIDNVPIEVLLHVVDGFLHELEIIRADGKPIKKLPELDSLEVCIN